MKKPLNAEDKPLFKAYSKAETALAIAIKKWLGETPNQTQAHLARSAGVDKGTAHQVLNGQYPSPPGDILAKLDSARNSITAKASIKPIFVETSVTKTVQYVCDRAREHADEDDLGVLYGRPGVGKTWAIEEYLKRNPQGIYIRAFDSFNISALLRELTEKTGAHVVKQSGSSLSSGTNQDKMMAIIKALRGTERFIIFDETTRAHRGCIETLRDISDSAGVAVIFAGRETLFPLLQDNQGRYGEISSRVGFWPPIIVGIAKEDCEAVVKAAMGDIDQQCINMFWECCDGSIRALSKLMASIQRYSINNNNAAPTPEIISTAWRKTINAGRSAVAYV